MKTIVKLLLVGFICIIFSTNSRCQDTCEYPAYTYWEPAINGYVTYCPVGAHPNGVCYIPCPEQ